MPRPSKKAADEAKAKAPQPLVASASAPAPIPIPTQPQLGGAPATLAPVHHGAPRQIDVEGFVRVRDSVHQRLLTILELIKSFSVDYYRQTNLLLGEPTNEGVPGIDVPIGQLEHAVQNLVPMPALIHGAPEYGAPVEEKKERKKRTHDPNAPKRPLTPYFLYMQTARPIIANDLGSEAPKGAVQEEGQRRWKAMSQAEKNGWNNAYQYNLRLYQARVHSYKQGNNPDARVMSDEDALQYADDNNIPLPHVDGDAVGDEQDAIAEQLNQAAAADESTSKTPKKGGSRKRKSEAAEAEAPKSAAAAAATPDKKRRRTSKAADAESKEEASTKKGARGKKAKN